MKHQCERPASGIIVWDSHARGNFDLDRWVINISGFIDSHTYQLTKQESLAWRLVAISYNRPHCLRH